ncbi:hypothetical protein LQZ18_04070 [Lachnospiraceae bacterium ZAX-1]
MSKAVKLLCLELARGAIPVIITIIISYVTSSGNNTMEDYSDVCQDDYLQIK